MAFEREYRDLSFVPRWAIIRTLCNQSVAEHSFYVALYAQQFAQLIQWTGDYGELLHTALLHDVEECFISDIPGPVKQQVVNRGKYTDFVYEELKKRFDTSLWPLSTDEINAIIKIADELEGIFHLGNEIQMGNSMVNKVYESRIDYLRNYYNKVMVDVFNWKPDDIGILWRMKIMPAIEHNSRGISQVLHGLETK